MGKPDKQAWKILLLLLSLGIINCKPLLLTSSSYDLTLLAGVCSASQECVKCLFHVAVRRELKVMQVVMHPHIIRLYEIIETHSDIYVVMEYVESGDLFDYIVLNGRLPEEEACHFFQQVQTLVFLQFVLLIHHMNKQQLNKLAECMLSHLNRVFKGCLSLSSSTFS